MDFSYSLAGFFVGAVVGLTGVGGGSLMTPLLVLVFGIHPATAVGTDLLYAAITKSGGSVVHARKGSVDWRIVGLLAAGSVTAAILTLTLVHHYAPGGLGGATKLISAALGVALLLTAVSLIFRRHLQAFALTHFPVEPNPRRTAILTVIVGLLLGVLVSISSVGAGALGVTALFFLYPKLPAIRIVGSDLAHAVPLTLVAGLGHWWYGSIDWTLLGALLVGSLPGIYLGSHLATRIPDRILRPTLAGMLILIGGKLIAQ
ncbi:MAG: sulfite exporter TauE/SafE family protein [Sterolibacterium sp.]|nr:sulfite exporter TauE/SafE family protein [Sterolibacterium sp.]MBP9798964.1 sulfite exporter TauE/SafE family protein [Sterolibacterium sp.]